MHYYPGAGDPFDWPILDFDHAVQHIEEIEERRHAEDKTAMGKIKKGFRDFFKVG